MIITVGGYDHTGDVVVEADIGGRIVTLYHDGEGVNLSPSKARELARALEILAAEAERK